MSNTYEQAFASFLECTDEKVRLREYLLSVIHQRQVTSLLDIGPGNGDLSVPLAIAVHRYLGIEPRRSYVERLRKAGLEVRESAFPTTVSDTFDMVLACHVVSLTDTPLTEFVSTAWQSVDEGGALLIVTHSGQENDWTRLTSPIGDHDLPIHRAVYTKLVDLLSECGMVATHTLQTSVASTDINEVLSALAFVWSDGDADRTDEFWEHADPIARVLQANYQQAGGVISFPFEHTILTTTNGGRA